MPGNNERKYKRTIDYLEEMVGADIKRDLLKVSIEDILVENFDTDIKLIGGEPQSAVDVADQIDKIQNILSGQALTVTDDGSFNVAGTVTVQESNPVDVSASEVDVDLNSQSLGSLTVTDDGNLAIASWNAGEIDVDLNSQSLGALTVTDNGSFEINTWNAGTLPTEQQTPVDITDDDARVLGDVDVTSMSGTSPTSATAGGTGSGSAAQLDLGSLRKDCDIFYDTSGAATITIEVSTDNATWRTFQTISVSAAESDIAQIDTAYRYVRAYIDANLNTLEIASKGD